MVEGWKDRIIESRYHCYLRLAVLAWPHLEDLG